MSKVQLVCFTREDWKYFCSKINFGASFLDARAIQIMNEPRIIDVKE